MVLSTVTASSKETALDYFPLSVEYVERLYAGGRIKGSRWVKREGRPSDDAVLAGRVIDRSIRPLIPGKTINIRCSGDRGQSFPWMGKMIRMCWEFVATAAAIAISSIPWNGPVSAVEWIRQIK